MRLFLYFLPLVILVPMFRFLIPRFPFHSRATASRHLAYSVLKGPDVAMFQMAGVVAVKAFDAPLEVKAVIAAFFAVSHGFALIWSPWMSGRPKVPFVFWPDLLIGFLLLAVLFVESYVSFVVVLIVCILVRSPVHTAIMSIGRSNYSPSCRNLIWSWTTAAMLVATMAFSKAAGWLLDYQEGTAAPYGFLKPVYRFLDYLEPSYRHVYPLAAIFTVAAAFQFRKIQVRREKTENRQAATGLSVSEIVGTFLKDKRFRRYQYSFMVFGSANLMLIPVQWDYLVKEFDVNYTLAGDVLILFPSLFQLLFLPFWGRVLDRWNPLMLRTVTTAVMAVTPIPWYFAHDLGPIYLSVCLTGIVAGGSGLIWVLGINYYASKSKVVSYAIIHQVMTGIRAVPAPYLGLVLAEHIGRRNTFLVSFVMMVLGSGIMLFETVTEKRTHGLRSYSEKERQLDGEED